MKRFVIGALVGGFMMWWYLNNYGEWRMWASGSLNDVGGKYRGDQHRRQADQVLR